MTISIDLDGMHRLADRITGFDSFARFTFQPYVKDIINTDVGGGLLLTTLRAKHLDHGERTNRRLGGMVGVAEAASSAMRNTLADIEQNEARNQVLFTSLTPFEPARTAPASLFSPDDPRLLTPIRNLDVSSMEPTAAGIMQVISDITDGVSPAFWLRGVIKRYVHIDPLDFLTDNLTGDWQAVARCADGYSRCSLSLQVTIDDIATWPQYADAAWQGADSRAVTATLGRFAEAVADEATLVERIMEAMGNIGDYITGLKIYYGTGRQEGPGPGISSGPSTPEPSCTFETAFRDFQVLLA